jgi:hypothetical protein
MRSIRRAVSLLLLVGFSAASSRAQVPLLPEEVERVDVIAIERDGRELYAFDALTGRRARARLELGEEVHFERARGRVGLILTDRRAIAVAPGTDFRELRFQLREEVPEIGLIEGQVAIVVTPRRALGFLASGGMWIEEGLSTDETAEVLRVGASAGVVVTNRRALGLAPDRQRFVALDLRVHEELESVTTQDTIVTVRTSRRILVFSARQATWTTQDRRLR